MLDAHLPRFRSSTFYRVIVRLSSPFGSELALPNQSLRGVVDYLASPLTEIRILFQVHLLAISRCSYLCTLVLFRSHALGLAMVIDHCFISTKTMSISAFSVIMVND